jgi:predicted small lipoprotein YifL
MPHAGKSCVRTVIGISLCDMTHRRVTDLDRHLRSRFLVFAIAVAIGGCGYKGPLYLPTAKPGAGKPAPIVIPAPDPDRPVPSEAAPPPK